MLFDFDKFVSQPIKTKHSCVLLWNVQAGRALNMNSTWATSAPQIPQAALKVGPNRVTCNCINMISVDVHPYKQSSMERQQPYLTSDSDTVCNVDTESLCSRPSIFSMEPSSDSDCSKTSSSSIGSRHNTRNCNSVNFSTQVEGDTVTRSKNKKTNFCTERGCESRVFSTYAALRMHRLRCHRDELSNVHDKHTNANELNSDLIASGNESLASVEHDYGSLMTSVSNKRCKSKLYVNRFPVDSAAEIFKFTGNEKGEM